MKSPTKYLVKLKANLRSAKAIIRDVPLNDVQTKLHELKVKAFVMLTHAALETYFEELGSAAVLQSRKDLKGGTISSSLVALVTTCVASEISEKARRGVSENIVRNLQTFSEEAANRYYRVIQENHGIKKDNLKELLLPVGVHPEEIDIALCNNLDSFGVLRGEFAHKVKVISTLDTPRTICERLDAILEAVPAIDKAVCVALAITMAAQKNPKVRA